MKFFVFVSFVWMVTGGNGVYARTPVSAAQVVSKSRAVTAQFYGEVQRLRQNLGEAERVLYTNHRIDEKLMHLVAEGAKQSTLTSGESVPPRITLGRIVPLDGGKEIDVGADPQQLLKMVADKNFIKALRKVHRSYQQQWRQLEQNKSYLADFHIFIQRHPIYTFILHDKNATVLKRNAASRILASLGTEPTWEALPLEKAKYEVDTLNGFSETIIATKQASADFYQALEELTQEFLSNEQELYREYDVAQKVSQYLIQRSIKGEFYGGTISNIANDNETSHDLLSAAVSPDYNAELEALNTDYLDRASQLPLFKEHAEHTKLWDANYMEMYSGRHIAFKLKGHVVGNLIKEMTGIALHDKHSNHKPLQP